MQQFLNTARRVVSRAVWATASLGLAGVAMAQGPQVGAPSPPTPVKPDDPPAIMSFLIMIAMIALVVFANAIPTKRGHQD
ncbi:MAG: hypothetical protein HBSAPP03_24280 [Phycisphaerae bacterium]|nr:MAG: hypothetical protein HBSAPP03_24280 [Phycisphaerae bacterium]